ncbi:MAG: DUF5011 domain-containing protein [Muribaculaceae bacterium]|nr:DUF5011 domain-containing protein [Muribaculaceae bacterium]
MKKSLIFLMAGAVAVAGLTGCSKDSEGLTKVTTYAVIELAGGQYATVEKGSTFVDPGFTATMGSEDVSGDVTISGSVNTAKCGFYTLTYSVVNPDGFAANATRTVAVVDHSSIASAYFASCKYGSRSYSNLKILITDNGDGTYAIDDLAGGLYCQGRYPGYEAYGYDFWYDEDLKLDGSTLTLAGEMGDGSNWYWGEPLDCVNGTYDAATGTISYLAAFSGNADDAISVTLTK